MRIGPQANLPRTNSTRTKISSVQKELPRSPANRLGSPSALRRPARGAPSGQRAPGERQKQRLRLSHRCVILKIAFNAPPPAGEGRILERLSGLRGGQQADDDREQHGAFDQGGGDDHGRADLAGRLGLAGDRLDRAAADAADAEAAAEMARPAPMRAAQLAGAVGGQEARRRGRRRPAPAPTPPARGPGPPRRTSARNPRAIIVNASLGVSLLCSSKKILS